LKTLFIFPPVHDFAMPYLAGPLLKGFLERAAPGVTVTCIDLNLEFFKHAIADYEQRLLEYREEVSSSNLSEAVRAAVNGRNKVLYSLDRFAQCNYPGHKWSLRNYKSPLERDTFSSCMEYSIQNSPYDILYRRFLEQQRKPDLCGVSLTVEDQLQPAFRLLRMIRDKWKDVPIVLGGNLVNRICRFMDRGVLAKLVDIIILREGEMPFLGLINLLRNGTSNEDPRLVVLKSSEIPIMSTLDSLPESFHTRIDIDGASPNFEDLPISDYFSAVPILPILMSRKCYWGKCEFCTIHSAWDPSHRRRSAIAIAEEIEESIALNSIRNFRVVDEACPPDLLNDVGTILRQKKIECSFVIYGILEKRFLQSKLVENIAKSGCRQIFFGLESKDSNVINSMSKQINRTHDVDKILATTAANGIHNYVFSMFGYPGESEDSRRMTVDYISSERNIHTAVISNFVAELESPFSRHNASRLFHDGRMTEKYASIETDAGSVPVLENGAEAAQRATSEIYSRRPDLALTSLLNDETRLELSRRFGPDFAQQAVADNPILPVELNNAIKQNLDERVRRRLT